MSNKIFRRTIFVPVEVDFDEEMDIVLEWKSPTRADIDASFRQQSYGNTKQYNLLLSAVLNPNNK